MTEEESHGRERPRADKRRKDTQDTDLFSLIEDLTSSVGTEESRETEVVELESKQRLGIATVGSLKQHPPNICVPPVHRGMVSELFHPGCRPWAALGGPAEAPKHPRGQPGQRGPVHGKGMPDSSPRHSRGALRRRFPGSRASIRRERKDGRLLLRFNDRGFVDPFYAQQVSDGTLKAFAYLLLLEDPRAPLLLFASRNPKTASTTSS